MKCWRSVISLAMVLVLMMSVFSGSVPWTASAASIEIALDKEELLLKYGKSATLKATVSGVENAEVKWLSDNPEIATVDSSGKVKGVKPGVTTVYATVNGVYAECRVIVMFKDVTSTSAYYFRPVYWAVDNGITTGYTGAKKGYFGPDDYCTRAQIVTFLYRMLYRGEDLSSVESFADVPDDAYYADAVKWAIVRKLTTGYTDSHGNPTGEFGPDDICTRGQIMTFIWRYAKPEAPDPNHLPSYSDVKETDYFYWPVIVATQFGVCTGYTDKNGKPTGIFGPNDSCTRGQAVTFLARSVSS